MSCRYCILRLSSLGDVAHVIPVLRALFRNQPDCSIDWIIDPHYRQLIPALPRLRLIDFDKRHSSNSILGLRKQLHNRYDALLLLQTSLRTNLISLAIKADRRLGWDRARAREGHQLCISERISETPPQHQVQGFLAFARALGCEDFEPEWNIPIATEDHNFAANLLPFTQPLLGISPCSSHAQRNWHANGYAKVAEHAHALGMRVCLLGGPGRLEQHMAASIISACAAPVINLVGRDTPRQMLALLQRCSILLAPDSGPAHWANALGVPVIGLHAATWSKRSGPYNSLQWCVDRFPEAARKFRNQPPEALRWGTRIEVAQVMQLIEVKDVLQKLDLLFARLEL